MGIQKLMAPTRVYKIIYKYEIQIKRNWKIHHMNFSSLQFRLPI